MSIHILTGIFKTGKSTIARTWLEHKNWLYIPQPYHRSKYPGKKSDSYFLSQEELLQTFDSRIQSEVYSRGFVLKDLELQHRTWYKRWQAVPEATLIDDPFMTFHAHHFTKKRDIQVYYALRNPRAYVDDCLKRDIMLSVSKLKKWDIIVQNGYLEWLDTKSVYCNKPATIMVLYAAYINHLMWLNNHQSINIIPLESVIYSGKISINTLPQKALSHCKSTESSDSDEMVSHYADLYDQILSHRVNL